jgi:hypothetical protein
MNWHREYQFSQYIEAVQPKYRPWSRHRLRANDFLSQPNQNKTITITTTLFPLFELPIGKKKPLVSFQFPIRKQKMS